MHGVVLLLLVVGQLVQSPGRTTFDTKLDLVVDPARLLGSALHLWNPDPSFGELQNQAYGYLFPQGAFFLLGDLANVPPWVTQRLWSALVLVLAYEGTRRLARALAPSWSPWLPLVAGLAYALAPRTLGLVGILSAEALPAAVLPWVVLPLVHVVSGRWGTARGALLSGAAFLFVGGVNATAAVAVLPLPLLLVVAAGPQVRRLRLGLAWGAAVLAASLWWLVPLLVLGRFSPAFLDVIETSRATTSTLGWTNVLRGQDHWLFSSIVDGRPWWRGPYEIATNPWLVALTTVVAAVSLLGLAHRRMPARLPLLGGALLGMLLLGVGHASLVGSPLAEPVRALLDGPLAPLRNVHKVDPVARLPLALGFAHAVGLLGTAAVRRRGIRRWVVASGAAVAVVALVASSGPLLTASTRQPGWSAVPSEWRAAAAHLGAAEPVGRTWVVPGSGFGRQTWGWTIDEPLQPLAEAPWVTRSQVPLVPPQTMRYLDALESRVTDGRGSLGLADALARAGITSVLVRHDLDVGPTSSVPAERAVQALDNSPGLVLDRTFDGGDGVRLDLYRVARPVARVAVTAEEDLQRVVGGPEAVVDLLDAGVGPDGGAALLVPSTEGDPDVVTDTPQRRERQFGRTLDAVGALLTPGEAFFTRRAVHDFAGAPGVELVTARSTDGSTVTASSSSGTADSVGPVRPELGPWAAVDGSTATTWRSAPITDPRGQWLDIALAAPRPVDHVDVVAGVDGFTGVPVRSVEVDTGRQRVAQHVDPASGFARVRLSGAPVDHVRVTVTDVRGQVTRGVVALREVTIPGVDLTRESVVPGTGAAPSSSVVLRADAGRRACTGRGTDLQCDTVLARRSEESSGLRRSIRTTAPGTWSVRGTVVATATPATSLLLDPLGAAATARATSVLSDDPLVAAVWAHDADPATWWSSAPGDPAPTLSLTWPQERTITGLTVDQPATGTRAADLVRVEAGGEVRELRLDRGGHVDLPPTRTAALRVTFVLGPQGADEAPAPLSVSELEVAGIEDLRHRPDRTAATGSPCGLGPEIRLDDQRIATRVTGTIADVLDGRPLALETCGAPGPLTVGAHRVAGVSTEQFAVASLTLEPATTTGEPDRPSPTSRTVAVGEWGRDRRVVDVGAGDAAVLHLPENVNAGWRATLDGRALDPVSVDGWQQGYRLPAGAGGRVLLEFTPDGPYRTGLLVGGLLAGGLALLAVLALATDARTRRHPDRRDRARPQPTWRTGPAGGRPGVVVVAATLLGGVAVGLGALVAVLLSRRRPTAPGVALVVALVLTAAAATLAAALGRPVSPGPTDALAGLALGLLAAVAVLPRRGNAATAPTTGDAGPPTDEEQR